MLRPFTLCLVCLLLSSCEPVQAPRHLTISILFRHADGTPDAGAEVVVVEHFGGPPAGRTTDIGHTDRNGRFELNGDYCLPVTVDVAGGFLRISSEKQPKSYVINVVEGHPLVYIFGPVVPTLSRKLGPRENCDWG
jgi:hypothetical protein